MKKIRSIDDIYDQIRDYDLVICNDAPLATALNNRMDKAFVGLFVVTPRQLAAKLSVEAVGTQIIGDLELVKKVSDDTGYGLKYVHGEITNFKAAAKYTSEPRMGKKARKVYEMYQAYNTLEKLMKEMSAFVEDYCRGKRVAVVGLELFDDLDKHMIPPDFDDIEIFVESENYTVPEIRLLGNNRQIADCAADIARRCGPEDVAIVLDVGGPIANAVKSSLYRERIPFINSLSVRDLGSVRNFIEFIRLALSYNTIFVKDVRELLSAYGGFVRSKYDEYYFSKYVQSLNRNENNERLAFMMERVSENTFMEMARCIPGSDRSSVIMLLNQMDYADSLVTKELLDDLSYVVNNIASLEHNEQISPEEKTGVLLVDCKNSVYIDRPVVIYTGMCSEWEVGLDKLDYVDPKKRLDIDYVNVLRFQALLQQGSVRFYFANATKGGKEAVPCRYFDAASRSRIYDWDDDGETIPEPVVRFSQVCDNIVVGPWKIEKTDRSVVTHSHDIEPGQAPSYFSNSGYTKFVKCPRQYMFSKLTGSPDNSKTYFGNLIHNYAEFLFSYPKIAKEHDVEYYVNIISERSASLNLPDLTEIDRGKFTSAIMAINAFADKLKIDDLEITYDPERKSDNIFFEHFGLTASSTKTEAKYKSRDSLMDGEMDLVHNGSVYDYKTGKIKSLDDLKNNIDLSKLFNKKDLSHIDFQPLFYLCLLEDEENTSDNDSCFNFFYVTQIYDSLLNVKNGNEDLANIIDSLSIDDCIRTVEIVDSLETLLGKFSNEKLFNRKKYKLYKESPLKFYLFCKENAGDDTSKWIDNSELIDAIAHEYGPLKNNSEPYSEAFTNAKGGIKNLHEYVSKYFIITDNKLVVLRKTVDLFRKRLIEDMARLKGYYYEKFPAMPLMDCSNCDFREMCTEEIKKGGETDVSE